MKKFIVIGISDHPTPFFPPEVMKIIQDGKVFSGGKRHHEIVRDLLPYDAQWIDITVPLSNVFMQYSAEETIVFASGDPLFFGFANTLQREFPQAKIRIFPTFNSLQMLAHRMLLPYHDMRIVSLTGRPWDAFDSALIERTAKIGILTDRDHTPAAIAQRMLKYGYGEYTMTVGEQLGNPKEERISTLSLAKACNQSFKNPNCIILRAISTSVKPFGLPDNQFALLDGREKMITKMPIRLLTLQALDLSQKKTFWDIGFCTGSISIEAKLLFPHLKIEAFEIRPECEAIILENMQRHGTPGIGIHIGDFLTTSCKNLVHPEAVFIGGHGGQLKKIMEKVLQYLPPDGVIVMNSVSKQSHQLWDESCEALGLQQIAPIHITLNDYNPINILKCHR